jgi:hypothetical protein
MPFTMLSNPDRSPKRECPDDDYVKCEPSDGTPEVTRSTDKRIGVFGVDFGASGRNALRVFGLPETKEMEMEIPPEAQAQLANETKTPLDQIARNRQVEFCPVFNGVLACTIDDEAFETKQEKLEELLQAHKAATDALAKHQQHNWPSTVTHNNETDRLAEVVKRTLDEYTKCNERFAQEAVRPDKIGVTIDAVLGILEVSATYTNTTRDCGELGVSLGATRGLTYLSVRTAIENYPSEVKCMLKKQAEKAYKETNKAKDLGAGKSENTRMAHKFRCKLPAGDTAVVTYRLKVADPEEHWTQQPVPAGAGNGGSPRHPRRAMEYAIFTPPGDGKLPIDFSLKVQDADDDSVSFGLPSSQAALAEATARGCQIVYMDVPDGMSHMYNLPSPENPVCIKVRALAEQWDTMDGLDLGNLSIESEPRVKVIAHARAGHPDVPGTDDDFGAFVVEQILPKAMPKSVEANRAPIAVDVALVLDASGSMFSIAPAGSGKSNIVKLGLQTGSTGKKLLGLLPYLRKHGLSVPGDRITFHMIRFHCTARYVANAVDLTGPNAEAEMNALVSAFQNATDSGGTTYGSWLTLVEELAKKDSRLVVWLGTDGGAYDGYNFFPRLEALKASKAHLSIVVCAMGAYLDEETARRTQTDGHRLMEDVGPSFTDFGYRLLFAAILKMMAGMSIKVHDTVMALTGYDEMPSIAADGTTVHNVRLGSTIRYTVRGKYDKTNPGVARLPAFSLGNGTPIKVDGTISHLPENPDAVLAMLDPMYCAPELAIVADAKEMQKRTIAGLGLANFRDTSETSCVTTYTFPGNKGALAPDVKARLPADILREGLLPAHVKAVAPWMANVGTTHQMPLFSVVYMEPPPVFRSLGGGDACYRSLGCSDDGDDDAPQFVSLSADAAPPPPAAAARSAPAPPPKASAKLDVDTNAVPTAQTYLAMRNHSYDNALREGALVKIVQQLSKYEICLKKMAAPKPAPGGDDMLTDERLEEMADEQGGECEDNLSALVDEVHGLVGVLVNMAFLTHSKGGVHILSKPIDDPTNAEQVLLRVKYLRAVAEGMAGIKPGEEPLYRPVFTFDRWDVPKADASGVVGPYTSFKASLTFVETLVMQEEQGITTADYIVGTAQESVEKVCAVLVKEWAHYKDFIAATVPAPALVRSPMPILGFEKETITIPPYDLPAQPCPRYGSPSQASYEEPAAPESKTDRAKFFAEIGDVVRKQVMAICIKKNA